MKKKIKTPLKKTDKRIYKFVQKSLEDRSIPPTVREIAKFVGISLVTAHTHLKQLRKMGILDFRYGNNRRVSRGIKIKTTVSIL